MDKKRHIIQALWLVLTNSFITGFKNGTIYRGELKSVCVPGLNCYSCPGAWGSCPIGSLQAVIGSGSFQLSFYVVGILSVFGITMGRFICGFLCPFGFLQDLLHKIPFVKKISTFRGEKQLRFLKYVILLVFVLILPMFVVDVIGDGDPAFCKYICPAGTLEAGIPLVLLNESLAAAAGWLYRWKLFILIAMILLSVMIYRPFCKYICPLGAIYGLFNRVSFYRYEVREEACVKCNICTKACKMGITPYETPNHRECIRCGACISSCPHKAIARERIMAKKAEERRA